MEFDAIVDELYALAPGDFVDARERRVKEARADGDRELAARVHALRRPTVTAWLVNLLVRDDRDAVDELLGLGEALREAQAALSGADLRKLSTERRRVIEALGRRVRSMAEDVGQQVGAEAQREVEATLEAALADPQAAAAVASGRLTSALRYSGFGTVDIDDAVATPPVEHRRPAPSRAARPRSSAPQRTKGKREDAANGPSAAERRAAERRQAQLDEARTAVTEAEEAHAAAAARLAERDSRLAAADENRDSASETVERLTAELKRARDELADADRAVRSASRERDRAAQSTEGAEKRVSAARRALERLEG